MYDVCHLLEQRELMSCYSNPLGSARVSSDVAGVARRKDNTVVQPKIETLPRFKARERRAKGD